MQNFSYEELQRQADRLEEQGNVYKNVMDNLNELAISIAGLLGNSDAETAQLSNGWKTWGAKAAESGTNSKSKIDQIVSEFNAYILNYKQNESQSVQEIQSNSSELDGWQP